MRNVTPCPNWRELLSAYQDQNLSPKDRKRVAAHLESCNDCRQALAQMDRDRDRFIETYMAPAEKADLRDSVLTALRTDSASAKEPKRFIFWDWVFHNISAAVIVTLILILAVFMSQGPQIDETKKAWQAQQQAATAEEAPYAGDRLARNMAAGRLNYSRDNDETLPLPDGWVAAQPGAVDGYISNYADVDGRHSKGAIAGYADDHAKYYQDAANSLRTRVAYDGIATIISKGTKIPPAAAVPTDGIYRATRVTGNDDLVIANSPSGLQIAYDIDYRLQVKNALQKSRQAQGIITGLGGFTMNYQYVQDEHEPAVACFNGKIPADKAEAALAQIEKLGNVRGLTIAGEDLTEQFQANRQEIARQTEHAKKLDAIANRIASKSAASVESQRNDAKGQVNAARQALTGLTTRHELVTITAAFYEAQPREPLTLARATAGTRHALNYALLLLVTIAVFFLVIALVAAPFVGLRYWKRRRSAG